MKILSRSFYAEILALQGFPAGLRASYFIRDNFGYSEIQDNQPFSIIWKQPGLNGTRGGLFRHFAEFVDAKKPKAFVAENVKGLITANNGRAIDTIIKDFESIAPGYVVKPHLYNFAEYGVPQFRERVLFVGVRIDTGFDFVHPKPSHGPNGTLPYVTAGEALEGVEKVPTNNEHINIKEKTRKVLELIPEGGNFTDIPKDNPLYVKGMISQLRQLLLLVAAGHGDITILNLVL